MNREPMTSGGYDKLTKELKELKEVKRPQIVEAITIARDFGDLKENAEYHSAKEEQVLIDKKIAELSSVIMQANIIDPSKVDKSKISFGLTAKLLDLSSDKEVTYTIVGANEGDPSKGKISYKTPLAKELIGKEVGDEFTMTLPNSETDYEVLEILYAED